MKFLVIVLVIRFVIGALIKEKNKKAETTVGVMKKDIFHPAEFDLR